MSLESPKNVGYELFMTGTVFVLGIVYVVTAGIFLIMGNINHTIGENLAMIVVGLMSMGIGGFLFRAVKQGKM